MKRDERKKIVLIDMDGVLCNYDKELLRRAHERLALPLYHPEDVHIFYTEEIFEEKFHTQVDALSCEKGFFASLEPVPYAIEAVKEILAFRNGNAMRVFFCTAPKKYEKNPHCAEEKCAWLERHFGSGFASKAILTRDKTLVFGDVLIDDKPRITGVTKPLWKHVLYDRPYNRMIALPRILRWDTWKESLLPILEL